METRMITCVRCKNKLDVPLYVSSLTCPKCGERIVLTGASVIPETDPDKAAGYIERKHGEAMELLPDEVLFEKGIFADFRTGDYPEKFRAFYKKLRPSVECVNSAYQYTTEFKKKVVVDYTKAVVKRISELTEKSAGQGYRLSDAFADARCIVSAYLVPAVIECKLDVSQPLADALIACWNKTYPKNKLGKSTFKAINDGFTRKLCYITTAICQNTEKSDDCEELTLLRHYRDGWLAGQPDGEMLIKEYYMYAPMIVSRIDGRGDRREIYASLLARYIEPCVEAIKLRDYDGCKAMYTDMVRETERLYL